MNWLAHLHLSEPTPEFRLGNLLPDFAPPPVLATLPQAYQPGIARHRQIDRLTDAHPVFRRSVRRLPPPFRRYGGVLVDVFFDHFLADEWEHFASCPLPEFAAEVYASFHSHGNELPPPVRRRLGWIEGSDLFCSYRHQEGLRAALRGMSRRLRRPFDLAASVEILQAEEAAFRADFRAFFPALQRALDKGEDTRGKPLKAPKPNAGEQ